MPGLLRQSIKWILLPGGVLLLITALTLIGALSWLKYDNDNLKYALEVGLSQWLQRDLEIGEVLEAQLGLDSYLVAKNVSLANPAWAEDSPFVSAGHIELEINLPSIWESGPVVIHRLVLDSVSLNLLAPEGEQATWKFWPDRERTKPVNEQAPFPVFIGDGSLNEAMITYRDPDQDLAIRLLETRIEQKTGENLLTLQAEGEVNDRRLSINGQAGPPRALFTGRDLSVDLAVQIDQLSLQGRGTVSDASTIEGLDLELKARSPISRPLLDMLGMPEVRDGPFHFDANFTSQGPELQVEVQGNLGEFDLGLRGSVEQPREIDGIRAAFSLDGPSLKEAGAMFEMHTLPDVPYLLTGKLMRRGGLLEFSEVTAEAGGSRVLVSGRLPAFPRIDDWRVSIEGHGINLALLGPALGLVDIPDSSYQLTGDLRPSDQGVELIDLKIESENSHLILNGVVGDGPEYYQTRLNFELAGQRIADMSPWLGLQKMPDQPFSIDGTASYQQSGWTLQDGKFNSRDLNVVLDVNVDRLINTGTIDGRIHVASPNPMATLRAYGLDTELELPLPLTFSGFVKGSPEVMTLERGELTIGEHSGSVSGDLGNLLDVERLRLQLGLSGPDLLQLYPLESMTLPGTIPYQASANLTFSKESMRIDGLELTLPDHQLDLAGNASIDTQQPLTVRAKITAQAASSHDLESLWTDQPQFLDSNLDLTANLVVSGSAIEIDPIKLDAGHSDIGGKLALTLDNRPFLKATITSEKLYLPLLVPELEQLEQSTQAPAEDEDFNIEDFTDALTQQELQERLIPGTPLNLDALRRIDANVDYRVNQLYLEEDAVSTVVAEFDLAKGVLTSDRFHWDGSFSKGEAVVYLDASSMPLTSRVEASGERIPFLWLLAGEPDNDGESVYRGRLESRGSTAREIAANLSGALIFRDEGGRLDNYDLDLLMGDLLGEIIDRLNPTTEARAHSEVECSAGAVMVTDGLVEVVPGLILRNDKLDFVSAGSINLNTETIDLAFSTRSRRGIGFSAGRTLTNYIKLGGTLANPRMTLDPRGAAISGSAAIATAGWSILAESMWDRWVLTAGDPCKRLIKKARDDKKRDYESLWRPKANPS